SPSSLVVDRPAVVRIDEAEIPQLRALIEIRHSGRGDLDQELREAVVDAELRDALLKRLKLLEKRVRTSPIEHGIDEAENGVFVLLIGTEPARVHLRFTKRLDHAGTQAVSKRHQVV